MSLFDKENKDLKNRSTLQDNVIAEEKVEVALKDQILKNLLNKLKEENVANKIIEAWTNGNTSRSEYLERLSEFLDVYDEFIDPIYQVAEDWQSAIHLPTILTIGRTYHSRMFAALLSLDPPFFTKARKEANTDRTPLVQDVMRYAIKSWINNNEGIEDVAEMWIWDWCMKGTGILKASWNREFSTFQDVETVLELGAPNVVTDPRNGEIIQIPNVLSKDVEVTKTVKIFDGPIARKINIEDILIVGGNGNIQKADYVIEQDYMTESELWSLVDQKVFDEEAVKKVIESQEDNKSSEFINDIKMQKREIAGLSTLDRVFDYDRYQILECYLKYDVTNSGIGSDLIVWIHPRTREILRATYLRRVTKAGLRPYFKIDFHRRENSEYSVGLVELLYSISKELDSMHNINMDIGILTSMPYGFYRPTANLSDETLAISPGVLIPLDNPQNDVYFPNLGNRTSFGFQEQAFLMNHVERLTSISELSLGIMSGNQGAARTATGARALVGESNVNLDIFVKRMNRGWSQYLQYLFSQLQEKMPEGLEFRVFGEDGNEYWRNVKSREEIAGMYDFELEANSASSNHQVQVDTANLVYQLTQNPLLLQLGITTPNEVYEAVKRLLQVNKVKDFSRYIRKPEGFERRFLPIEILNRILAGNNIKLDPTQDLEGFIAICDEFLSKDDLLGQFNEQQVSMIKAKQMEAANLMQALQQAAAQQANMQQMQNNQQLGASMAGIGMNTPELAEAPQGIE